MLIRYIQKWNILLLSTVGNCSKTSGLVASHSIKKRQLGSVGSTSTRNGEAWVPRLFLTHCFVLGGL